MKITAISDLHGHYPELPGGDLLIVAGDLTARDRKSEYVKFSDWYLSQDYKKKVLIAGNHDGCIQRGDYYFNHDWLGYLCDSGTEFEGLKIWGSPWTTKFSGMNPHCRAFTCDSDEQLAEKWAMVPSDVNILITHSPPYGILDETKEGESVGSKSLEDKVFYSLKIELHVFGHIHEEGGKIEYRTRNASDKHISVNASLVNERYEPVNNPVEIEL
jgi:Icc-related predicted phosphoesterase